jgi:hypothetical protein
MGNCLSSSEVLRGDFFKEVPVIQGFVYQHSTDDTFDHSNSTNRDDLCEVVLDCAHSHVKELGNNVFVCTKCRQRIEGDVCKLDQELQWKTHIDTMEDLMGPSCASPIDRGVSASWLIEFTSMHDLWEMPTWKVCRDYIVPATQTTRCRFVDLPEMQVSRNIGRASTYICHCWGAPFGLIAATLRDDGLDEAFVWLDLFAVRQWPCTRPDLDIENIIPQCSAFMVVCPYFFDVSSMSPGQKINWNFTGVPSIVTETVPFLRSWCLLEMVIAINTPDLPWRVRIGALNKSLWSSEYRSEMLSALFYMVDINKAAATYGNDKSWLQEKLVSEYCGMEVINSTIRRIVLESINDSVDCCHVVDLANQGHNHALNSILTECNEELNCKHWLEAARCGYTKILKAMVGCGLTIDIDCADESGTTALMQASFLGHIAVSSFLLNLPCNLDAVDGHGRTAAFLAATAGQASCLELLVSHGCRVDTKAFFGRTACFMAATMGHDDCLAILIKKKCDVNAAADDGRTALMMAAMSGSEACIRLLLNAGSDLRRIDDDGCDALHLSREFPLCEQLLTKAAKKAAILNIFHL